MRRFYAFEAEELSPEVKTQLEKVEDVVEDKCDTPEACDKMIDKIDGEQAKFNEALQTMSNAAKDCKDGKCDKAEMAATVAPKMAELKEVAKSIGVASEGDTLTEGELKDAKAYLEGAKEIVEAKKDELENGTAAPEKKEEEKCEECDEKAEGAEECASEAFIDIAIYASANESFYPTSAAEAIEYLNAMESECLVAMEGYNWDKRKEYNAKMKEIKAEVKKAKAAAKAGDAATVKSCMSNAITMLTEYKKSFTEAVKEEQSALDAVCGYFAYGWRALGLELLTLLPTLGLGIFAVELKHGIEFWVDIGQAIAKASKGEKLKASDFNMYTKSMEHNMDLMIGWYKKVASKLDAKAIKKAAKKGEGAAPEGEPAAATDSFLGFCQACESLMIDGVSKQSNAPYLFG